MAYIGERTREKDLNALDTGLRLYDMDEQGLTFIKAETGIEDEEELKKHILAVRAEGYSVRLRFGLAFLAAVLNVARYVLPFRSTLMRALCALLSSSEPVRAVIAARV